jgi:hypothetical protein
MMRFFKQIKNNPKPYEDIEYFSRLTIIEIKERLEENIEPKKIFRFNFLGMNSDSYEHFEGSLTNGEF